MALLQGLLLAFFFCSSETPVGVALPESSFFDFGIRKNDRTLPKRDDASSEEIQLRVPIAFFDEKYLSLFVNVNGHVTFETELPVYQSNLIIPTPYKMIAPFLADVDTTASGSVYYRETQDSYLIGEMNRKVDTYFPGSNFRARSLFIVTWHEVGYFNRQNDQVNTFQLVIGSNGQDSYALFNYADNGVNWIKGMSKSNLVNHPAQMGFSSGSEYRHLKLPYSGTRNGIDVARNSNINIAGQYLFHLGDTHGANIGQPDPNDFDTGSGSIFEEDILGPITCAAGNAGCHINATCVDYQSGFCCKCKPKSYGNGLSCLTEGISQQLNGRVIISLNHDARQTLVQHSFIVTHSGRAYSSISPVPTEIGNSLILLDGLNSFLGFLFGLPNAKGTRNGFMMTGGKLTRLVKVKFQTGEMVTINQRFFGHDTESSFRTDTNITGSIPVIGNGSQIRIDEYNEDYIHPRHGLLLSNSTRVYRVNDKAYTYTWSQEIHFDECSHDHAIGENLRHTTHRTYINFKADEQSVRFIVASRVSSMTVADSCLNAVCGRNSYCVPHEGRHECVCNAGFRKINHQCEDTDECVENICGPNAQCINTQGSYSCLCHPGYSMVNSKCVFRGNRNVCGDKVCDQYARCVYNVDIKGPACECNPGYKGDGVTCDVIEYGCQEVNNCGENARCVYDADSQAYKCECDDGFSGDGMTCTETELEINCKHCDENAHCFYDSARLFYRCRCNEGYTGDGRSCSALDSCGECSPHAECQFEQTIQRYVCRCKPGFRGNGYECRTERCPDCGENAHCDIDRHHNMYICRCDAGFVGSGGECRPATSCFQMNCDANAECVPHPHDPSRFRCQCRPGYIGDGATCEVKDATKTSCNLVNNCHRHAECIYDRLEGGYRCKCRRGYHGDGMTCARREPDCSANPRMCHPKAECVRNVDKHVCICNEGFHGDGRNCSPITSDQSYLVYIRGKSIMEMPYVDSRVNGKRITYIENQMPIALDYDCRDSRIYYTDISSKTIRSINFDGGDEKIVVRDVGSGEGVAVDWLSRNLYWTDAHFDRIEVAKLDGSDRKTLFDHEIYDPRAIVVDPTRGVFYWTDWSRENPKIEKAYMDGTARKVFIGTGLKTPNALTLDLQTQQLCWGDKDLSKIECIRTDGVGRRVVYELRNHKLDIFDMVFSGNSIYWTDWSRSTISNMKWNSDAPSEPLSTPIGGNGKMYGITAVNNVCPQQSNACVHNNGGCRFLCLPTPGVGRTCSCPNDVDEQNCSNIALLSMK